MKDKLGFFEYKEVMFGFLNELIAASIDAEKLEDILYATWHSYYNSEIESLQIKRDAKVLETVIYFVNK